MIRNLTVLAASFSGLLFATLASASSISISTDVLNGGNVAHGTLPDGTSSPTAQVNFVHFISTGATQAAANPAAVPYDSAGNTVNLTGEIAPGAPERGASQQLQINGYSNPGGTNPANTNNFISGQPDLNNPGFGAHANWVVTLNLDAIRAADFGGSTSLLGLEGIFGAWGAIGDKSGGKIQGEILLDGTRIDSMGQTSATPVVNQPFNLVIPSSAHELSFLILNGNTTSSLWNNGIFENVSLRTVPEPSSLILCGLGLVGLVVAARRRK